MARRGYTILLAAAIVLTGCLSAGAAKAQSVDTKALFAYLVDDDTGSVLLNKQGDDKMVPSSMTKLMTMYLLDERLKEGRVKLTDVFHVSEKAWRMQGSKMFVPLGGDVPVEDLVRGIIIQSGNDACIVAAEGLSGSEENFAREMNRMAKKLGLNGSHFMNATGWPDPEHYMTAHDLALLAHHVIHDYPDSYHYYTEKTFTYNRISQFNRNRLLGNDIGVDGLKTGHTDDGGYGITLSAKEPQSGRRLILVINGLQSDNDRMEEGDRLLRWGFREFQDVTVVKAGEAVDEAKIWFGVKPAVALTAEKDVVLTLPANAEEAAKFKLVYTGPVPAPVQKGQHIADLVVTLEGHESQAVPLVAAEDVPKLSGFRKAWATLNYLVFERKHAAAPAAAPQKQ